MTTEEQVVVRGHLETNQVPQTASEEELQS